MAQEGKIHYTKSTSNQGAVMSEEDPYTLGQSDESNNTIKSEDLIAEAYAAVKSAPEQEYPPPSVTQAPVPGPPRTVQKKQSYTPQRTSSPPPPPPPPSGYPTVTTSAPSGYPTVSTPAPGQYAGQPSGQTKRQTKRQSPPPPTTQPVSYGAGQPAPSASGNTNRNKPPVSTQKPKKNTNSGCFSWLVVAIIIVFVLPWMTGIFESESCSSTGSSSSSSSFLDGFDSSSADNYREYLEPDGIEIELMRVGNESTGYTEIPSSFVLETEEGESSNTLRYVDPDTSSVIILTAYSSEEGLSQGQRAEQRTAELEASEGSYASLYEDEYHTGVIEGNVDQLYGSFTETDALAPRSITQFFFTTSDGIVRSITFEESASNTLMYTYDDEGDSKSYFGIVSMMYDFELNS